MEYKVEMTVLCEVRVWGRIEADSMQEAMGRALAINTGSLLYDHEIVSDVRTLAIDVKEAV